VLRFLNSLTRVFLGFIIACIVAGLATILFVDTPAEIAAAPGAEVQSRAGQALELALLTATHSAIFSFVFVIIAAVIAEWLAIRSLPYYLIAGTGIALLGFFAQYQSEVSGQPTILNNYALKAFLTSGFFAGFAYWLIAGRFSGRLPDEIEPEPTPTPYTPPAPKKGGSSPDVNTGTGAPSQADNRRQTIASRRMMPSVSSRIIDITSDSGERAAVVAAASARAAALSLRDHPDRSQPFETNNDPAANDGVDDCDRDRSR